MMAMPSDLVCTPIATRSRSDSRTLAVFTARTSTTSLSQPCTSTVPFTFCSSNVPPGCSAYDWLNSLLMANPGTAAIANANDNTNAGTNSLRSFITTPSEDSARVAKLALLPNNVSTLAPIEQATLSVSPVQISCSNC